MGNAARVLDLLSAGPAYQPLTELVERSGLSTTAVHRILRSLMAIGFVEQNSESRRYSLGAEFVRLSQCYLLRLPLIQAAAPYLVELRKDTKATIKIGLLVRGWIVYVDHVDGEHPSGGVYRGSHRSCPAFETAAGQVLVARAGPEAWEAAVGAAAAHDLATAGIAVSRWTREDRAQWARSAYLALGEPHSPDMLEVAVPVTDQRHRVLGSLSASDRRAAFTAEAIEDRIAPQLLRAAYAIGQSAACW